MKCGVALLLAATLWSSCGVSREVWGTALGGTLGSIAGSVLGGAVGGGIASQVGGTVGGIAGASVGHKIARSKKGQPEYVNLEEMKRFEGQYEQGNLVLSNFRLIDEGGNGILNPNERAMVAFDVENRSVTSVSRFAMTPKVNTKRIQLYTKSEQHSLAPGEKATYKVALLATDRLKSGKAVVTLLFKQEYQEEFSHKVRLQTEE